MTGESWKRPAAAFLFLNWKDRCSKAGERLLFFGLFLRFRYRPFPLPSAGCLRNFGQKSAALILSLLFYGDAEGGLRQVQIFCRFGKASGFIDFIDVIHRLEHDGNFLINDIYWFD